jgi:hypothetical protein
MRVAVLFSRDGESTVMSAGEFNRRAGCLISIDRDRHAQNKRFIPSILKGHQHVE